MSDLPTPESLRELGESTTNVANAWAGAEEYLSRGVVVWAQRQLSGDQGRSVGAAIAACRLVIDRYPTDGNDAHAPKQYLDDMLSKIQRWADNPSNTNKEAVRGALDTTRQLHAWHGHAEHAHFWILEAVDHACMAVWSGERASYIIALDYSTCAARCLACVLHALLVGGTSEADAIGKLVATVTPAA